MKTLQDSSQLIAQNAAMDGMALIAQKLVATRYNLSGVVYRCGESNQLDNTQSNVSSMQCNLSSNTGR